MRLIDADALLTELNNIKYPGAPYVDAGIRIAVGKVCDAQTIELINGQAATDIKVPIQNNLPPAQPEYYDYSDIEPLWKSFAEENDINLTDTAKQLKDAMWCGYRKGKADAQLEPSQVARDIATIIENEMDMRVIARSEITDEQAIEHLQASGWMQRHDKEMYESGLRHCQNSRVERREE